MSLLLAKPRPLLSLLSPKIDAANTMMPDDQPAVNTL